MPQVQSVNEGLWRFGGMYGSAWRDAAMLTEVVELTAAVEINRLEVPLTGTTKQGYKPGRESREGSLRFQKMDTAWELEVYHFLSMSLEDRRRNRDEGNPSLRPFQLQMEFDDPDALGYEAWQLEGCLLWRLPLGFSITDDIVDREIPLTWEVETPLDTFIRTGQVVGGVPQVAKVHSTKVTGGTGTP